MSWLCCISRASLSLFCSCKSSDLVQEFSKKTNHFWITLLLCFYPQWKRNSSPEAIVRKCSIKKLFLEISLFFHRSSIFFFIFSKVHWRSAHNIKNDVLTFRRELRKREKSRTKHFTLSKQTFSSQYVMFLNSELSTVSSTIKIKKALIKKIP